MIPPPETSNTGVAHGAWGETMAVRFLRQRGYEIRARNVRPCRWDRRLEIDIVAYDKRHDILVFVEVKQHKTRSIYACRLQSITKHKKELLRKACRAYLARTHWQAAYRFDVIEVFGVPEAKELPVLDHIERVPLFVAESQYVNWAE